MQRNDLAGVDIDDSGAGIAAERRRIVGQRVHQRLEALDLIARPYSAGLQTFNIVRACKNAVLEVKVAARVPSGIADSNDLMADELFWRFDRQVERGNPTETVDAEQRHVPIGMNHFDAVNLQIAGAIVRWCVDLPLEVYRRVARLI